MEAMDLKTWLIILLSLILVVCIIMIGVMSANNWDFSKLSTSKYETNIYELQEDFNAISIFSDTADITFLPSNSTKCQVVCREYANTSHAVGINSDTLQIKTVDTRKWYEYIGINFDKIAITVYLPKTEYTSLLIEESTGDIEIPSAFRFENVDISLSTGDVDFSASATGTIKIHASTGDIDVENISAGVLDLAVSTGDIAVSNVNCQEDIRIEVTTGDAELSDILCENLTSTGDTGDLQIKNVIASDKFSIERNTGNVKFIACDAAEILVTTDTGHVTGSLLSDKVFIITTDTGWVDVPKTVNGGKCEITTDTGNIKITVEKTLR